MSPEANLLRLAYIQINALLDAGFETNADEVIKNYRQGCPSHVAFGFVLDHVAKTLSEIRDLFGADDMDRPGYFDC
tara:strand:+ start:341 stop:568 length:228 start_codon:yes stop_codon:yes gene_type:complete